jgi:MFS family permease
MGNNAFSDRLRRDLRAISGDGVGFSVMVGMGETYVPALALALGMGEVAAGWIVAAPLLLGAMLQLISPLAVRRLRSHRRWVVFCAGGQTACCLAYAGLALAGAVPAGLLFLVATLYWGMGMAGGPAWNTWVGTLIPARIRSRYLARRGRSCQAAVLIGLVLGGLALQLGSDERWLLYVFAAMFLVSGIARGASTWCLVKQSEPQPFPVHHRLVPPRELIRRARRGADGRLLVFMLAMQAAVQITGPFFTPYMLGALQFSYAKYLLLIATAYVAKMIAFPFLGSVAKRYGSAWLLYASAAGIVPLSALWIVSTSLPYLLVVQIVGGVIWAGYELATLLLLFERIDETERTSVLTIFNLANATALVGGALVGGTLLKALGTDRDAYHLLFGLSGAARLIALILMARLGRVAFRPAMIVTRVLGVRPNTGSLDAPLVTSLAPPPEDEAVAADEPAPEEPTVS